MIDTAYWLGEFKRLRDEDGGYAYEGLAIAMVLAMGWTRAAAVAKDVGRLGEDWPHGIDPAAQALYDEMGWHQAVLFAAWFRRLDHYDHFRVSHP